MDSHRARITPIACCIFASLFIHPNVGLTAQSPEVVAYNKLIMAGNVAAQTGDFPLAIAKYLHAKRTKEAQGCIKVFLAIRIAVAQRLEHEVELKNLSRAEAGSKFEEEYDRKWIANPCNRP